MKVLVCGGAGYIGSHMCELLVKEGHDVILLDNFSTGNRFVTYYYKYITADLVDYSSIHAVFGRFDFDIVMHFASLSLIGDSVLDPSTYYKNNLIGSYNLFEAMINSNCKNIIFSSTAAVYGIPSNSHSYIGESCPTYPINPYGRTKFIIEEMLRDYKIYGINSLSFRYFNAAGASTSGNFGESHSPESHLIPNILTSIIDGKKLKIFGNDYLTDDGTCIRDYIHVEDICDAHLKGMDFLLKNPEAHVTNLGGSKGFSILEIIKEVEKVTGKKVEYEFVERREGDPPSLIAISKKAEAQLGWSPRHDLHSIIKSAWYWINKEKK